MIYNNIEKALFLERPNRFIATCNLDGKIITAHVKNTGRCHELLVPGATVYLDKSLSETRKTSHTLIAVEKNGRLINMDSLAPNVVVGIELRHGILSNIFPNPTKLVQSEKFYKKSRFDFYVETEKDKIFVEVKGVTLEKNNVAMFPDAPTERGLKHITELIDAKNNGFLAYIIFVVQMKNVNYFMPNSETHKAFAETLKEAKRQGVEILAYDCLITPASMILSDKVEARL